MLRRPIQGFLVNDDDDDEKEDYLNCNSTVLLKTKMNLL